MELDDEQQQGRRRAQARATTGSLSEMEMEADAVVVVEKGAGADNFSAIVVRLVKFAVMSSLTFLISFAIPTATQIALGHLSAEALAAGSLGTIIYNFTGYSLVIGLLSAQDTLSPQAFGADEFATVGIVLQRSVVVVLACLLPVSVAWANAEAILLALKQPPQVAALASRFLTVMLAGMPPTLCNEALKRFLQAQGVFRPMIYCSCATALLHPVLVYALVFRSSLEFYGGPVANVVSAWVGFLLLLGFTLVVRPHHPLTWPGFSSKAFQKWGEFLKLGIPGAASICLEWWGFEILTLRAGAINTVSLAAMNVLSMIIALCFMVPLGIATAAQTVVGNCLGAGHHRTARSAGFVAVALALVMGCCTSLTTYFLRHEVAPAFTNDADVAALVKTAMPVVAVFVVVDGCQGTCQGVMRGAGKQNLSAIVMSVMIYGVSLPCAFALANRDGVRGIWVGTLVGYVILTTCVLLLIWCLRWDKIAEEVRKRTQATENAADDAGADAKAQPGPEGRTLRSKVAGLYNKTHRTKGNKDEATKGRDKGLANQDEMAEGTEVELGDVGSRRSS